MNKFLNMNIFQICEQTYKIMNIARQTNGHTEKDGINITIHYTYLNKKMH